RDRQGHQEPRTRLRGRPQLLHPRGRRRPLRRGLVRGGGPDGGRPAAARVLVRRPAEGEEAPGGLAGPVSIPVRNLYYLLLYAYDALDEGEVVEAGALPETGVADLFAHVLDAGVNHLLRRGLDRGHVPVREAIPGVRGRVDVSATVKAATRSRARA